MTISRWCVDSSARCCLAGLSASRRTCATSDSRCYRGSTAKAAPTLGGPRTLGFLRGLARNGLPALVARPASICRPRGGRFGSRFDEASTATAVYDTSRTRIRDLRRTGQREGAFTGLSIAAPTASTGTPALWSLSATTRLPRRRAGRRHLEDPKVGASADGLRERAFTGLSSGAPASILKRFAAVRFCGRLRETHTRERSAVLPPA